MIKTILVSTDFSDHAQRAFEKACDLARQVDARIYLLHVQADSPLRTAVKEGLLANASTDDELQELVNQLIEERFSQMQRAVEHSQILIEHTSRRGDPDAVIPSYAKEVGADLIAIGRRGAGLIDQMRAVVLGSVAECVIRKSPCPVMVVRLEH